MGRHNDRGKQLRQVYNDESTSLAVELTSRGFHGPLASVNASGPIVSVATYISSSCYKTFTVAG